MGVAVRVVQQYDELMGALVFYNSSPLAVLPFVYPVVQSVVQTQNKNASKCAHTHSAERQPVFVLIKIFEHKKERFDTALLVYPIFEYFPSATHGFLCFISHKTFRPVLVWAHMNGVIIIAAIGTMSQRTPQWPTSPIRIFDAKLAVVNGRPERATVRQLRSPELVAVATHFAGAFTRRFAGPFTMHRFPPQLKGFQVITQLHMSAATASAIVVFAHTETFVPFKGTEADLKRSKQ